MNLEEKVSLINAYEKGFDAIIQFVKGLPDRVHDFRPDLDDAWTVREHIVHLFDADTFGYGRVRLCVTEPGAQVYVWDEHAWQQRSSLKDVDLLAALETARSLRKIACDILRPIAADDWSSCHIMHKVRGRISLEDVLKIYTGHSDAHQKFCERNLELYKKL